MWVMITDIRNVEDALRAWNRGADALGLLVKQADDFKTDFISPKVATSITKYLSCVSQCPPPFKLQARQEHQYQYQPSSPSANKERFCDSVLVTHLLDVQKIIGLASTIGVTAIQLVGNNSPEEVCTIKETLHDIKVIKSIPVIDDSCMDQVKKYMEVVDAIELDTIDIAANKFGGTGKTHDWDISKKIVQEYEHKVPIILAGGLHSDNIEQAIQTVKPFGVDVSSGIKHEDRRYIQNERLMTSFISKAKDFQYERSWQTTRSAS